MGVGRFIVAEHVRVLDDEGKLGHAQGMCEQVKHGEFRRV
jgi:hypothetical protein